MTGTWLQLSIITGLVFGILVGVMKIRKNTDQILAALMDAKKRNGNALHGIHFHENFPIGETIRDAKERKG